MSPKFILCTFIIAGVGSTRSMRSGKEEENLVSLPSGGEEEESEGEAELTSDEESESD